jgi:hypothetical protein
MARNECSRYAGIGVHDGPENAPVEVLGDDDGITAAVKTNSSAVMFCVSPGQTEAFPQRRCLIEVTMLLVTASSGESICNQTLAFSP